MEQSLKWELPTPRSPALSRSPRSRVSWPGAHARHGRTAGRTGPAAPGPGCSCARRPPRPLPWPAGPPSPTSLRAPARPGISLPLRGC